MQKINNSEYIKPIMDIMYNNFYGSASVPSILESWSKNKYDLYKRFGNKTIIKSEEISLAIEDNHEISISFRDFQDRTREFFSSEYTHSSFSDFLRYVVGTKGFKENLVRGNWDSQQIERYYDSFYTPAERERYNVPSGMKLSKSFKMFFNLRGEDKEEQEDKLKALQNLYSTYRQNFSAKKKGRLFLSIDPFDFLSISDNNHNWSSCHNLADGEYRVGNLNYMSDAVTAVGYYASDDKFDESLDIFQGVKEWNSKRWRVLIHLQVVEGKLTVAYNKQYPFTSDILMTELDSLVMSVCEDTTPSEFMSYDDDRVNSRIIDRGYDSCHYSDFRSDSNCFARISEEYINKTKEIDRLVVGQHILCVECGGSITTREESGRCDSCSEEFYCDSCEGCYNEEDMVYVECIDESVCYDCYEQNYRSCDECGEDHPTDQVTYSEVLGTALCDNCLEYIQDKRATVIFALNDGAYNVLNSGLTEAQLKDIYQLASETHNLVAKRESSEGRFVTTTKILNGSEDYEHPTNRGPASNFQARLFYVRGNSTYRPIHSNNSPFEDLYEYQEDLPNLDKVLFTGVMNERSLAEYINQTIDSMKELDIDIEALDYSAVRVV